MLLLLTLNTPGARLRATKATFKGAASSVLLPQSVTGGLFSSYSF